MNIIQKDLAALQAEEQKIWNFIVTKFHQLEDWAENFLKNDVTIIIGIVTKIKTAIESQSATVIAEIIDGLTKTGVALEVIAIVKLAVAKALSVLSAIALPVDLNDEAALQGWLTNVFVILKADPNKGKIYSTIFAHVLQDVRAFLQDGVAPTFGQAIVFGEKEYAFIKGELASAQN